jgi:hypothetical protein
VDDAALVGAVVSLHPEVPLLVLAGLVHLQVAGLRGVIGRGRAAMIAASTIVPDFSSSGLSPSIECTAANIGSVSRCFSSRCGSLNDRACSSYRVPTPLPAEKPATHSSRARR